MPQLPTVYHSSRYDATSAPHGEDDESMRQMCVCGAVLCSMAWLHASHVAFAMRALSWSTPPPSAWRAPLPSPGDEVRAARRRLHARGPLMSWHSLAPPSGVPPQLAKQEPLDGCHRTPHQLAGPPLPSFRLLIAREEGDRERRIWELGFCPSRRFIRHEDDQGRLSDRMA
uniref:Uncharacterized protein n=1 Tax=Oryza nivara TaxID=4536 RepID=A0A0E0GTL1_ORYNI